MNEISSQNSIIDYGNFVVSNAAFIVPSDIVPTTIVSAGELVESCDMSSGDIQFVDGGTVNSAALNPQVNPYFLVSVVSTEPIFSADGSSYGDRILVASVDQYVFSGGSVNNVELNGYTQHQWLASFQGGIYNIISCPVRQYVFDGGVVNGGTIHGGEQYIASAGVVNSIILNASNSQQGATNDYFDAKVEQYILSGGIAKNTNILRGYQYVSSGGEADSTVLNFRWDGIFTDNSVGQYVYAGAIVKDTLILSGTQYVSSGGIAQNTILSGGTVNGIVRYNTAIQYVDSGGIVKDTSILSGTQYILSGGVGQNTIVTGGNIIVSVGGVANDAIISDVGSMVIYSGGQIGGQTLVSSGGYLSIANGGQLEGNVTLNHGGSMTIGLSNGGSVDLIGNNNSGLTISGYVAGVNTSVSTEITNFSGLGADYSDKVTIDGLQAANVSSVTYPDDNHITLQLLDGTSLTLNMVGIKQTGYTLGSDASGNLTMIVCFLSGTLIRMVDGDCAVEDIQVGDTVLTYDVQTKKKVFKKVVWVGKQTARVNPQLTDDYAGYPVRILKDTFTKGVPNKDLLITPEHCLFIDGYFIPARMLVNGRSIYYDYSMTSYEYYHVETEEHSVIWADNMQTETYLNTGNRHQFNRDEKVVALDRQIKDWKRDAAAPLMVERSFVESVFNRLSKRANRQKLPLRNDHEITLSYDHGLYLLTEDGEEIYQSRTDQDQVIFTLPANTQNVYLVSKKSRPCDVIGPFVDDRHFRGVLVGKVSVLNQYGAYPMTQYLKTEELQGWSVIEQYSCRWTMGCALLPLDVYNADYSFEISIQIISAGPYLVKKIINEKEEEKIAV